MLADALIRNLPQDGNSRKLVLFSDSRQDAAKLFSGIEQGHYLDLIRQFVSRVHGRAGADVKAFVKKLEKQPLAERDAELALEFEESFPEEALAIERVAQNRASERQEKVARQARRSRLVHLCHWCRMSDVP